MRHDDPARNDAPAASLFMQAPGGAQSDAAAPSHEVDALPRLLGRYALLKLLVRGGMGEVFLATTIGIEGAERPCVVKRIRRDYRDDPSFRARFLDEARVQAQLDDPGVAHVLEATVDEHGDPYVVVEYIEGRSLADLRARLTRVGNAMPWADAVAVTLEIASALAHIHERTGSDGAPLGIVHRDLSPQNVMVGFSGDVKMIDFGTARGDNRRCHTISGTVLAKPGYVAPEVARGDAATPRADLYALGVMLWEMVSGKRFLEGEATEHVALVSKGLLRPAALASGAAGAEGSVPVELDRVVAWLTEPLASARCPRARDAAQALASLLTRAPRRPAEQRGVRARVKALLARLYPNEPAASRVEFAKLVVKARASLGTLLTTATTSDPNRTSAMQESTANSTPSESPTQFPEALAGTRYKLIRRLGEGAMGVVYEAEHIDLGRRVAVKVLHPQHSSSPEFVTRFRREARAIAGLAQPNLVQVFDFGQARDTVSETGQRSSGRLFFVMEKLEGETLESYLDREGGVDWRDGCELAIKTCRALEAAHAANLVHRDLKPANLFLTFAGQRPGALSECGLKLLDFGVAKGSTDGAAIGDEGLSHAGAIFGTPDTMAPEQITGTKVDGRADLYALGCVLYELVTGSMPFEAPTSILLMSCHLRQAPMPPRQRAPERGIPDAVERAVLKAMSKDPADRFASASEMRETLEEACFGAFFAEGAALSGGDVARSGHVIKATTSSGESLDVLVDDGRGSRPSRLDAEALAGGDGHDDESVHVHARSEAGASLGALAVDDDFLNDDSDEERDRARALARRRRIARPLGYAALTGLSALAIAALAQSHALPGGARHVVASADWGTRIHDVAAGVSNGVAAAFHDLRGDRVHAAKPPATWIEPTSDAMSRMQAGSDGVEEGFRVVDAQMPARLLARLMEMDRPSPLLLDTPTEASLDAPLRTSDGAAKMGLPSASLTPAPAAAPTLAEAEAKLAAHDAKGALAIARTLKADPSLGSTRIWARAAYAASELKEAHDVALTWIAHTTDDMDGLMARLLDARALTALGRLDEARARLDATAKTHPNSREVKSLLRDLDRIEHIDRTDRADRSDKPPASSSAHPRGLHPAASKHRIAESPQKVTPRK